VPARHVATQERALRKDVQLVQSAQTKFPVDEPRVDLRVDVLRVKLLDQDPPVGPSDPGRNQVFSRGNEEVALVRDQRRVREQESEGTFSKPSTIAFPEPSRSGLLRAKTIWRAGEIIDPQARLQQEAWDRFEEDPARRPDKMHVHLLGDKDLPIEQELVVQWTGRHGPTHDPQPAENFM
jgi:hypothetical protein